MKKTTPWISGLLFFCLLGFIQTNFSSCKKEIQTVHDTIPPIKLSDGLVAYYPFNNNVNDSTPNKNNGTAYGDLQFTTDKSNTPNSAALFNGTNSYILVNDNGSLSPTSITIAAQFYVTSNLHQNLISKINFSNSNSIVWGIAPFGGENVTNPGDISFGIRGPGIACGSFDPMSLSDVTWSLGAIQLNKWYHITCVFDNGLESLYINGVLRNAITRDFTQAKQCADAQLAIGAWWQKDPKFFNGKIDEVRIYNRKLNFREIQELARDF